MPEAWLSTTAGLQVPGTLLSEIKGSEGTVLPEQMEADVPILNTGVILGLMVTVNV